MTRRKAASDPANETRPTSGGAYIRAADGTLERDGDTEQAPDAGVPPTDAPAPEPTETPAANEQEA